MLSRLYVNNERADCYTTIQMENNFEQVSDWGKGLTRPCNWTVLKLGDFARSARLSQPIIKNISAPVPSSDFRSAIVYLPPMV